eukprot:c6542_g1_i1.p2 GENE.c6542_g1_i1~~c6542_g1_i1.p2  ORF type:complete len:168 (+),score=39.33 c6542_g1_i1:138-641(+)
MLRLAAISARSVCQITPVVQARFASAAAAESGAAKLTAGGHHTADALKAPKTEGALKDTKMHIMFEKSTKVLAIAVPLALVFSPSKINVVVDLAISGLLPYHGYVGIANTIDDYVPRGSVEVLKAAALIAMGLTAAGMLKSTMFGSGPTEAVKSLWVDRKPDTATTH